MRRRYDCVIFDMDGTLTRPQLDFDVIRAELGVEPGEAVLEALAEMPPARRARAQQQLLRWELEAAAEAEAVDGAVELVGRLAEVELPTALLTRNCREAMEIVLDRLGLTFDVAVAREDGPAKPDPESIRAICRRLGADPARAVCVGDWLFDVQAANAAGAVSVLVARGRRLDWADQADIVIDTLDELEPILEL